MPATYNKCLGKLSDYDSMPICDFILLERAMASASSIPFKFTRSRRRRRTTTVKPRAPLSFSFLYDRDSPTVMGRIDCGQYGKEWPSIQV